MRHDDSYLIDMLQAARKAAVFAADLTYPQFQATLTENRRMEREHAAQKRVTETLPGKEPACLNHCCFS